MFSIATLSHNMAAAGGFIVRVRAPSGMKRFAFGSDKEKFGAFQAQVQQELGIPVDAQLISLKPLADPEFLLQCGDRTFQQLGIKHGDMLNIVFDGAVASPAPAAPATPAADAPKPFKLTNKCQHGPKDRCIHCASGEVGKGETKFVCNHPASSVCINCSTYKAAAKPTCNHPSGAFCINCAPEQKQDANRPDADLEAKKRMFCHCKGGQKCIHCSQQITAVKVDMVPFARLMGERRAMCHFKHGADKMCPSCAPEEMPNFRGNPKCTNGHLPWPNGCCSKCMPPNAVLKLQNYRHCDYISVVDEAIGNKFVSEWLKNPMVQRATYLFGNYIDEPAETKNPGAIRAQVQALYYPPQENKSDRVNLLRDPKEDTVLKVGAALGIHPVGLAVTSLPRPSLDKYGGPMFLSGPEIRQAARLQARFTDAESNRSPFVTMLFLLNAEQQVEPVAYQVSDTCVALESAGVLSDVANDVGMLAVRAAKKDEFLPGVMYKNKLMNPEEPFVPDELIVKVVASAAAPGKVRPATLFRYARFPFVGTNAHLSAQLTQNAKDEWHVKLSDFNLLCHLPSVIGLPRTLSVCEAVKAKRPLTGPERIELEKALKAANISF